MLNMRYINSNEIYSVNFKTISPNIVELTGDFPAKTDGFILSREEYEDNWDYSEYTTVYGEIENGVHFSNDGSTRPEITDGDTDINIDNTPYTPTLEESKLLKITEMNNAQQITIKSGTDVTLTDGTTEHFTLTEHDQTSLVALQTQVVAGMEQIPWHTSDTSEHCKYYSNADMALITATTLAYVTFHVTYFRDLRIYVNSLKTVEDVEAVVYGMLIPEEYQSEPLKDMLAQMV